MNQTDAPTMPLGRVLTLAGSGGAMNANTVITNMDTVEKLFLWGYDTFPKFSIMNPEFTILLR